MKNLLMFLNEYFQRFCKIHQKLLNATRYAYRLFKLQFKKLNKNNKFSFKFNVVNDDKNVNIF